MTRLHVSLFTFAMVLGFGTGCSSIRVVRKTPDGGTVALQGAQDGAREKAEQYMRGQCPKGYDIVEEGEAVIGQDVQAREQKTILGPVTTAQSTDRREWRITYKCKGAATASARTVVVQF